MTLLLVALVAALFLLPLVLAAARRRIDDAWGPDADKPSGYQLTDRGNAAVDNPTEWVLDENAETWGPA